MHQIRPEVHTILTVGPSGEPLLPTTVVSKYSNQCSCLVRSRVSIGYENWNDVPEGDKRWVWDQMLLRFIFPENTDLAKCERYHIAATAMRSFRYRMKRDYVEKGKTPFAKYTCVKPEHWEAFVQNCQSDAAKEKSKKFSELAKKNVIPHHMGNIGYAGHAPRWHAEERERAEAGLPDPYDGCDERTRNYVYGHKPTKKKGDKALEPNPKLVEAEKAIIAVTQATKSGSSFEIRRGKDVLTAALGNPEHRGRVRGLSSRKSWKTVDSWQTDAATYHTRQRYKEGLREEGHEEIKAMITESLAEMFTSKDPKLVELRTSMFRKAGLQVTTPATGHLATPATEQRYPVDDVTEMTKCLLLVPISRGGKKKVVADGFVYPPNQEHNDYTKSDIPEGHTIVSVGWVTQEFEEYELDVPNPYKIKVLGRALCLDVPWMKEDIELEMPTPASQPSVAGSTPPGDDGGGDDDDDGGDDGKDKGPHRENTPPNRSPSPSHPQSSPPLRTPPTSPSNAAPSVEEGPREPSTPPYTQGLQPTTGQEAEASGYKTPPAYESEAQGYPDAPQRLDGEELDKAIVPFKPLPYSIAFPRYARNGGHT